MSSLFRTLFVDSALGPFEGHTGPGSISDQSHLGQDGYSYFLWALGADIQTHGSIDASDIVVVESALLEAVHPEFVGTPATHGADVADRTI
jgi:hypothetical protein